AHRAVDPEEMEGVGLLVPTAKGAEAESHLVDGSGGDGEVVALRPRRVGVEADGAAKGGGHPLAERAADDRAPGAAEEGEGGDHRRRLRRAVVLLEEAGDEAGAEE